MNFCFATESRISSAQPTPRPQRAVTLDSTLLMGFDVLCDGQRAFINCTRDLLLKDGITLLPSGQTVVEVLEDVEPDDLIIAACQRLKVAGYTIALDDYVSNDSTYTTQWSREAMTPLADVIKVDFERTTAEEQAALVKRYSASGCRMLAEKSGNARAVYGGSGHAVRLLPGIFLPPSGSAEGAGDSRQPRE